MLLIDKWGKIFLFSSLTKIKEQTYGGKKMTIAKKKDLRNNISDTSVFRNNKELESLVKRVWQWKLTWHAANMHKGGRYIDARIQLSRENMISDYNSASSNSTSYLLEKLLFYIYYEHVNRTHAVGARC